MSTLPSPSTFGDKGGARVTFEVTADGPKTYLITIEVGGKIVAAEVRAMRYVPNSGDAEHFAREHRDDIGSPVGPMTTILIAPPEPVNTLVEGPT